MARSIGVYRKRWIFAVMRKRRLPILGEAPPAPSGRIMSSLAGYGGLAGKGGLAGGGGGLAG